jgi:hypothetical protein
MNNPAPGSRVRSARAFDRGVARCRTFAVGPRVYRLAGCRSRQAVDRYSHLRSDRGALSAPAPSNPPGSPRLLWATRRRFDPSSSPSANDTAACISPSMNKLRISQ